MTPRLDTSARTVEDQPEPAAAPVKKSTMKSSAKKASLKAVAAEAVPADPKVTDPDTADVDPEDLALEDLEVEDVVEVDDEADTEVVVPTDVVLDLETDEVVLTVGKKRTLDDVDESTFEPAEEA